MDKLREVWKGMAKSVLVSLVLIILMNVAFIFGSLSILGAVVIGTSAIVFAVLSLRE